MNKIAKERIIFQNYDLDDYEKDYRAEYEDEDFSEEAMWDYIYEIVNENLEDTIIQLESFFKNQIIAFGNLGRWDGVYSGGAVFNNFRNAFYNITEDCPYIKIYDENGHLFIHCTHHDGSSTFEIKELTKKGEEYYDRWEYSYDSRTKKDCHKQLIERYTTVPNFAHKTYGCKVREYEPITKQSLQNKLNNKAVSFYS